MIIDFAQYNILYTMYNALTTMIYRTASITHEPYFSIYEIPTIVQSSCINVVTISTNAL